MANREHIEILQLGVEEWNRWRKAHPDIEPYLVEVDLSGADLSGADLSGANLTWAKLSKAKLSEANLRGAYLNGADLNRAYLKEANLGRAKLIGADLSGADLGNTDLAEADLAEAKLSWADLNRAYLADAYLADAYLADAYLADAYLAGATLSRATLRKANLTRATLTKATLREVDLRWAYLTEANLEDASLPASRLMNANFDGANLTKARLWETQRAGWSIKGVICESIYWDENGKEESFYSPGEFERLFADKTKVKLFYKDGINPLEIATIPALIKHLEGSHPGCGLRLVSIHEDSGGVVVELAIEGAGVTSPEQLKQLKAEIEMVAQRAIVFERKFLAEEKQRLQLEGALNQSNAVIDKLILRPSVNFQGDYKQMGNTYNVSGQAGAVGDNAIAGNMTFNQIVNHFEQSIDLQALATELAELRQAMSQIQGSSPQTAMALGKVAEAEIAAQEKKPGKVMESLKAAGEWTLDFAKEIGKDVVVEAIKQSMGMP
ncbi:MAG TPA: pentapeptide repeat-containing protein [Blastocatellia bacterium]|nr:pentapeptide repeat-containing protein [Blastocatellia bacterium]